MLEQVPKVWKLLIFPIFAIAFFVATFLSSYQFFYEGGYNPPVAPQIYFEEILAIPASPEEFTDRPVFAANPVGAANRGTLLVDTGHRNAFSNDEITTLLERVYGRGYDVEFILEPGASFLAEGLMSADAFVVISPTIAYGRDEADLVVDFVEQGGRLLLVADPGRPNRLNSLAERLGVSFRPDYLYNLAEHDSNFQEFYVRDFEAHALTAGIGEMVFFYAGSIESAGEPLARTDGNTQSSISELNVPRSPLATGAYRNVLAVHDLTFMIPPYNAVRDNNILVANIADYLTEEQRDYRLADFPGFLKGDVNILLGQPDLFEQATQLKQDLRGLGIDSEVREVEDSSLDTVFLGLYEDYSRVARYLDAAGVIVGDSLTAPFAPGISLDETSVLLLHRAGDRDVLIALSATPTGVGDLVKQLNAGTFRAGLADDFAGVYRTK